jgi:hypothetical protein
MAGAMARFTYTSDDGNDYRIAMDASNAAAVSAVANPGPTNKPGRLKPRYILCKHPTSGRERAITVTDPSIAVWLGTSDTISLVDVSVFPSVSTAYNVLGRIGERRLG